MKILALLTSIINFKILKTIFLNIYKNFYIFKYYRILANLAELNIKSYIKFYYNSNYDLFLKYIC